MEYNTALNKVIDNLARHAVTNYFNGSSNVWHNVETAGAIMALEVVFGKDIYIDVPALLKIRFEEIIKETRAEWEKEK